jgi:outer membrane beta-barrel protein
VRVKTGALPRLALCAALLTASIPFAARAEETAEEPGRLAAVQKRRFRLNHEIFASAGFLPLDAFYKGIGPVVSYTWHTSDVWGWEVIRGQYSFAFDTNLRDQLLNDHGVKPTAFEEAQLLLTSSFIWTPLYGKMALFNSKVVHSEMYGILGATVARFSKGSFKPGPEAGVGFRFFLASAISLRTEVRYHYLFAKSSSGVLDVAAGLAFNLGGVE